MAHTLPARRVGMFGGAFDPPHWAHRALAETALRQLGLDVLHILPTGHAWHKSRVLSSAEDRVAMCELAFGDLPKVQLDEREIHREGPSYTADTLRELQREYPQAQLFLVLGADQLLAFRNWVRWQEVLDLATLAVANRATNIGADAPLDQATETDLSGVDLPFEPLHMPLKNISATAVRARVGRHTRSQDALDVLVPEPVARYISQHHLYQPPT
ncbi:MAG: nicotinate (nicotinamide) nucleotide adenylyltransferase [Hydrogenophaga sp.]|jgi:nicotinate-nucleotide adenylyltransferase|uniref:nicotinate (nicotinamide) nucleotide adenylyltransferase n=1 Tax=Hydrogenophaga sp. TaxID=1904254 RepID=UPI00260CF16B|nr:nicotinate (nicotinamide) nucleotide adenylyltransferase [Hydrogenophaga sp.]MCV0440716.1 nicotinate (nicotinamide) nucleotide adenylyltransferase [Hydrogenophaga sp.]